MKCQECGKQLKVLEGNGKEKSIFYCDCNLWRKKRSKSFWDKFFEE